MNMTKNPHSKNTGYFSGIRSIRSVPFFYKGIPLNAVQHISDVVKSTIVDKVLLYRLASSFSPKRCHKNRFYEFMETLLFRKA